jgi:tripartite-type tricarboxylate transporter receptor subunit TctC
MPDIGRAIVAEPGIPAERTVALRKAFSAAMADPDLVADFKKRGLMLEPLSGEEVHSTVRAAVATPQALVEQAKRYIGQ